jgi:hypothetical protein
MSAEMIAPEWMHSQITAAEYESHRSGVRVVV